MTTVDKQAAIAALKADLDELRVAVTSHGTGYDRKPVAIASALGNARRLIAALEADDGRALLRQLREHVAEWQRLHEQAIGDPTVDQRVLQGYLAIERDVMDKIDRLLAAEPAQIAEPTAPAGDDEARIAECMHRVGQAMLSMRHDWMLCVYDRDNPEDQKRKEAVESIGEAFALMREILSRAVKAEGDLRDVTRRNASWCEHQHSVLRDLRAKLAEAEKARDAAIAAQNARAVEELEALRNWWLGKYNGSIGTVVLVDKIGLRLAALRSSPPAAPAGEAPAQGAGDDVLRTASATRYVSGPEMTDRVRDDAIRELCRRELARGER